MRGESPNSTSDPPVDGDAPLQQHNQHQQQQEQQQQQQQQQALYGIVQGGVYPDLREESCAFTNETPFFGTAVGGTRNGFVLFNGS
jgi:tRNA-guanine family transglycosylase